MTMINNAEAGELFRSPSGLLTRTAWEDELESSFDQMPRWYRSPLNGTGGSPAGSMPKPRGSPATWTG